MKKHSDRTYFWLWLHVCGYAGALAFCRVMGYSHKPKFKELQAEFDRLVEYMKRRKKAVLDYFEK